MRFIHVWATRTPVKSREQYHFLWSSRFWSNFLNEETEIFMCKCSKKSLWFLYSYMYHCYSSIIHFKSLVFQVVHVVCLHSWFSPWHCDAGITIQGLSFLKLKNWGHFQGNCIIDFFCFKSKFLCWLYKLVAKDLFFSTAGHQPPSEDHRFELIGILIVWQKI